MVISYSAVEFVIPRKFIYNLAENCITRFINYCVTNKRMPFQNNSDFKRRFTLTWNDKNV